VDGSPIIDEHLFEDDVLDPDGPVFVGFGSEHPQVLGIPAPGERDVELAVREDVLLDVDANPAERESLRLVDGHREGDADRELPPLQLEGAHVVRREHLGDGDFLAHLGPVEDPGEDRGDQNMPCRDTPRNGLVAYKVCCPSKNFAKLFSKTFGLDDPRATFLGTHAYIGLYIHHGRYCGEKEDASRTVWLGRNTISESVWIPRAARPWPACPCALG